MRLEFDISELDKTKAIAEKLAELVKKGDVVILNGNLGAGKTTFTQFLIKKLIPEARVTSPTFTILNIYDGVDFPIYHYDLYRIKNKNELEELAINEAISHALTIIEWPEIAVELLGNNTIEVKFQFDEDSKRKIFISSKNNSLLEKLS